MENLSPASGRYCLQVADQLFYACDDIEEDGTSEQSQKLKRKFERAFGNAWERIPRKNRADILAYWEARSRSRSTMPDLSPHIELECSWSSFDEEDELGYWQIGEDGMVLLFWSQAIEAMPEKAVVSVVIEALSFVSVYAQHYKEDTDVGDARDRATRAYFIRMCDWRYGGRPLDNWNKSKQGKKFCSHWKRWFGLLDLNFGIDDGQY